MAIVVQEIVDRVRFLMGDPSQEVISDQQITDIANNCISEIGNEDSDKCEVTYCTLINTLRYLINKERADSSNKSGAVKKRKEKRGETEIEEQYSDSGSAQGYGGWNDMLNEYLADPTLVCAELAREAANNLIIIGGVSQSEYDRVNDDLDKRNGYMQKNSRRYNYSTFNYSGNRNNRFRNYRNTKR
ncbi:head completion adaptor [Vibrio phage 1.170.O._10N.261.52.C3]|nr:head completion adaptor [Vibrio phage 1.170.O._10N.261.52.C3]